MTRTALTPWARVLWDGLCRGLCATGAFLAMQNGFAMTTPGDAPIRSDATTGV